MKIYRRTAAVMGLLTFSVAIPALSAAPQPKPLERGIAQWSANSSRFITFSFYVLSLEYPHVLSSSI
jgi:hypothetical protein